MTLVCGVDGCRGGWVGVSLDLETRTIRCEVFPTFLDLVRRQPAPGVIAIDVPIGLSDLGSRPCDIEARRLLGPGRASSVFPAPIRPILAASSHAEASALRRSLEGKGVTVQAWAIVPKIREVDEALRNSSDLRRRVREVHPELGFYHLAGGRAMADGKKAPAGREARRELLVARFGDAVDRAFEERRARVCSRDDIIDAFVALWTARRIAREEAVTIPASPSRDRFDLPMEMLA